METKKLGAEGILETQKGTGILTFPRFWDPRSLAYGVSTRLGGYSQGRHSTLNLSFKTQDTDWRVRLNRRKLSKATGLDFKNVFWVNQVHGDKVLQVDNSHLSARTDGPLGDADGLITREKGALLLILVADCLPVLFYDPVNQAIGMAHAGWRGTISHVAAKTLLRMASTFGTKPFETRVLLGPCIGPCCYEVGEDVKKEVAEVFPWGGEVLSPSAKGHWKFDLAEANARQLLEVGIKEENLVRAGLCTVRHSDLFYSHRAEASTQQPTGRFGAFIQLDAE